MWLTPEKKLPRTKTFPNKPDTKAFTETLDGIEEKPEEHKISAISLFRTFVNEISETRQVAMDGFYFWPNYCSFWELYEFEVCR